MVFDVNMTRKLRCARNTLHIHLFVSFILRAILAFVKDQVMVSGVGLSKDIYFININRLPRQRHGIVVCYCLHCSRVCDVIALLLDD